MSILVGGARAALQRVCWLHCKLHQWHSLNMLLLLLRGTQCPLLLVKPTQHFRVLTGSVASFTDGTAPTCCTCEGTQCPFLLVKPTLHFSVLPGSAASFTNGTASTCCTCEGKQCPFLLVKPTLHTSVLTVSAASFTDGTAPTCCPCEGTQCPFLLVKPTLHFSVLLALLQASPIAQPQHAVPAKARSVHSCW